MRFVARALLMLSALTVAAGCSASGDEQIVSVPDPTLDVPVLTLSGQCFGECSALEPPALPTVAVYPDGTTITAIFEDGNEFTIRRGTVSTDTLDELRDLAHAAGLEGDGVLPELALPDNIRIEDGGASIFSLRSGADIATRSVPHLYDTDFNREGPRREFRRIQEALLSLPEGEPWAWEQEALLVERFDHPPAAQNPTWSGPDFRAELEATPLGRCAITPSQGPLTADSTFGPAFDVDGELWRVVRRPLLPHESTCSDIADFSLDR